MTRITYGPFGAEQTVSDPLGNTTTNSFDTNGNLVETLTPTGVATIYTYDAHNNLASVAQAGGGNGTGTTGSHSGTGGGSAPPAAVTLFTYDSSGYLATSTSPTGVVTTFSYDANGNSKGSSFVWVNPANSSDMRTVTTSAGFDPNDQQNAATDEYNHNSQTHYDFKGRITQSLDVLGNPTGYVYDASDHVIQTTFPNGTVSESFYDSEGRVSYSDDAHVPGQTTVRGTHTIYDSMGRVTETDRLDNIVIIVSTSSGVSNSQVTSQGNVVSITKSAYNDLGQVTQSTDAANQPTLYQYDAAGRQVAVTDALNETTLTAHDAAGRETSTTDALNHTTQYFYDADGKQTQTLFADGTSTQTAYDSLGRKSSTTDQMGRTTNYQYDAQGHLTSVILPTVYDPLAQKLTQPTTQYGYDPYGNMFKITDANQHVTQFTFDQFGHQLTRTLPMGQTENATYDSFGRENISTDFKGQQTQNHYDSLGRLYEKDFYAAGATSPGETVVYSFDSLGREYQYTDTIGTNVRLKQYGFDAEDRVSSITTPEGTVNYVFDPATGFHTRTYTVNSDITYTPDALQRLKTVTVTKQNGVTLTTPLVTTYFYTVVGTIDHVTYPNGTETDYGYDNLNRTTSVTNKRGATLLSSYVYTLEADGLQKSVTEQQLEADGTYSTVTKTWTYDALQRLTEENYVSTISANNYDDQYIYDIVGNRRSKTHIAGSQTLVISDTYNANDQIDPLTPETGTLNGTVVYQTTYGYDANGSQTSVTRTGSGAETDAYGYDLRNRLLSANISRTENGQSVTIVANYAYDDSGSRAQSIVTTTIGGGSPTTTTTQFLVDANNPTGFTQVLEEHTNGSALPSTSYIIGRAVLAQSDSSGIINYLLLDIEASTRLVANGSGIIIARFAYDAYGVLLGSTIGILSPPLTRILYTGQQVDLVLLQYYLRARFYDPTTGLFTSLDTFAGRIRNPGTLHKYAYTADSPINRTDPAGTDPYGGGLGTAVDIGLSMTIVQFAFAMVATAASMFLVLGVAYVLSMARLHNLEILVQAAKEEGPKGPCKINDGVVGPYHYLEGLTKTLIAKERRFQPEQKELILIANKLEHGGVLMSDAPDDPVKGELVKPMFRPEEKPRDENGLLNEAQVDHIKPRGQGGSNSYCNAQVVSQQYNLNKNIQE